MSSNQKAEHIIGLNVHSKQLSLDYRKQTTGKKAANQDLVTDIMWRISLYNERIWGFSIFLQTIQEQKMRQR